MTDITTQEPLKSSAHKIGSDYHHALQRKRYRNEFLFKFFGISAILISVSFLFFLLWTVVGQSIPAFTYNYVKLPVNLETIDPASPEKGDYDGVLKQGISQAMPYLSGRKGRRLARGIVSGGSGIELRNAVIENPSIAGRASDFGVPVSDYADLYLKGLFAKSKVSQPDTNLTLSGTQGTLTIEAGDEVFAGFLAEIKNVIGERADVLSRRMDALQRSLDHQLSIKANSSDDETIEDATTQIQSIEAQIVTLKASFDALIARKDAAKAREQLDADMPSLLLKIAGGIIKVTEIDAKSAIGEVIIPINATSAVAKEWTIQTIADPENIRAKSLPDKQIIALDKLVEEDRIESRWNSIFFSKGASREPELAGIWGAVVGSFFTMLVTLALSFPLGVAAAVYLEEFAPRNKITALIEVNINNLAAVPSIVFGLLGLAIFLNFFSLPRSAPVVGGMVLALMTLPTIIIASRAALKAVPPSIREAALGVGASKLQAVFHHVLPLAMPGILTGTIIGMAQALGETAPLLMIGMVAFVVDIPGNFLDPSTVLPVQIYMWADFPEIGFQQKTAAAIVVLLGFLVIMNALAVFLRKRFERRW